MEQVIRLGLAVLCCGAACQRPSERPAATGETAAYDILLRGGWIVDGSSNPRWRGDLAIRGDRVAAMGRLAATARETLVVSGLVVAPGFIDMLGQSETSVQIDNRVLSKVTQGITTELTGEGGSVAPLTDRLVALDSDFMKKDGFAVDWRDWATFEKPHQPSVGIMYVFVNGQAVLRRGQVTAARPGRGLRGPGYVPPERRGKR